jgi:hypothetical protein
VSAVDVVIPWAGKCPHRVAALTWVRDRYYQLGWTVSVAHYTGCPWVKAAAVNPMVAAASAPVVVVADADCWSVDVPAAVEAVAAGEAEWAVPMHRIRRFNREFTVRVLGGADPDRHTSTSLEERVYHARDGGGIVVARRDVLVDVPLDPRFEGWGGEDVSWGTALRCLHGRPWRGTADLWHLWHPPQPRSDRVVLTQANDALARRYDHARNNPDVMRALVDEAGR